MGKLFKGILQLHKAECASSLTQFKFTLDYPLERFNPEHGTPIGLRTGNRKKLIGVGSSLVMRHTVVLTMLSVRKICTPDDVRW